MLTYHVSSSGMFKPSDALKKFELFGLSAMTSSLSIFIATLILSVEHSVTIPRDTATPHPSIEAIN